MSNYKPESPSSFKSDQVIINSGRLLFNAKSDGIFLFGKKTIGLSSAGSVNIDCNQEFIVNSKRIDLGLNATEPLLLGNQTINNLSRIIEQINLLCDQLSSLVGVPAGVPFLSLNSTAISVKGNLNEISSKLNDLKSKQNFTI